MSSTDGSFIAWPHAYSSMAVVAKLAAPSPCAGSRVVWKRRHHRTDEFLRQLDRVRDLAG